MLFIGKPKGRSKMISNVCIMISNACINVCKNVQNALCLYVGLGLWLRMFVGIYAHIFIVTNKINRYLLLTSLSRCSSQHFSFTIANVHARVSRKIDLDIHTDQYICRHRNLNTYMYIYIYIYTYVHIWMYAYTHIYLTSTAMSQQSHEKMDW